MKRILLTGWMLVAMLCGSAHIALATDDEEEDVINRVPMDLIITSENAATCNHDFSSAKAWLRIREKNNGKTKVVIRIRKAKPNHIYTVWLKLDGVSPISGGGATPLAAPADIANIIANADTQSASADNAFYTNSRGHGYLEVWFPDHVFSTGIYKFSDVDPNFADVAIGTSPFTIRVISHCTDDLQHGLSAGTHEPTFQISL